MPKACSTSVTVGASIGNAAATLLPEAWERFEAGAPGVADLPDSYARLLESPAVRMQAARDWCAWEIAMLGTDGPDPRWDDAAFRYGFARQVTHDWRHAAWLEDGAPLRGMARLARISGVLVHGRLDHGSPLATVWDLHRAWPGSALVVLRRAGHDRGVPGMAEVLAAAAGRFAPQR